LTFSKSGWMINYFTFQWMEKTVGFWTWSAGQYRDLSWDPYYMLCMYHHFSTFITFWTLRMTTFIIRWSNSRTELISDLERSLEAISVWLRGSGLAVNESKTELCQFHWLDQPSLTINLFNSKINSKSTMNVLGVIFDKKCNDQHKFQMQS
jgi:hypothetical protein